MSTSTFNLTWEQALALALAGQNIRRDSWSQWLGYTTGIWRLLDRSLSPIEVVTATDFTSGDFLASDWTTDPISTSRDVCLVEPPKNNNFTPPSLSLTINLQSGTLTALIGASSPLGAFNLVFYINGAVAGGATGTNGAIEIPMTFPSGLINARVEATNCLPLPSWIGSANATAYLPFPSGTISTTSWNNYDPSGPYYNNAGYSADIIGDIATRVFTNPFRQPASLRITGAADDGIRINGGGFINGFGGLGGSACTLTVAALGDTSITLVNTIYGGTWTNLTLTWTTI